MELVINSRGAHISKVDERFQVTIDGVKQEFSSKKVEKILITTSALVTTDALKLAIENNIDVVFLEYSGKPFARVWHSKLGSITTIRRHQLKLNEISMGTEFVKEWIDQKISNQINHLNKLKLNRSEEKVELIDEAIKDMEEHKCALSVLNNVPIDIIRGTMEGHEGYCARRYFSTLGELIPEKYKFKGRSKNPASDQFNCMLNYAYGVLYSRVESSCIIAGLDPYIGIMHTDNYNRTALVFDLIEMYRGYMDEVVFSLFSKRKIKQDMFDKIEGGGYWLNKLGKQTLIEAVNNRFEEKIKYKGRVIRLNNVIQYDCHNIANKILNEVM
ncbi:CRISPR-associated protein Cas1 [Clostridium sulfidigenes]|uniref:CRISPR-associated endonuclease Cas1 n=1 Tax=Clostridium sulfidigenes TaxID=318464 RepID=A0A084JEU7_9CLOT|nr:CRISPR-associated endonuclease Cas1 [Clostridium sulfidigenes]KEZ87481.1 CRISPR-associated protein Cas1 [Clostridium sulfidigenes]